MQLSNNKILITGGASGIGLGLSRRFHELGNTIIVCGRREDFLEKAANELPGLITKACDLSQENDRIALFEWIATEHPDLNTLVNNAGIQQWMNISDADFYQRARQEMNVNMETPVHLCHLFSALPSLKTIINVSSGLSFVPLTKVPVYSATKAFFHSFTKSLRYLLAPQGIDVIELIPPALNTDLGGPGLHDAAPPVSAFVDAVFEQLEQGTKEITFGFSEAMLKAGPAELEQAFVRMNP